MDKIETKTGVNHWLIERIDDSSDHNGRRYGKAGCGRKVHGKTGGCMPSLISCGNCKKELRRLGWKV